MKKYTLKALKNLIESGAARDITNETNIFDVLPKNYEKIGYSAGMYGINGGLIKDENGGLYVIKARNSNLFRVF